MNNLDIIAERVQDYGNDHGLTVFDDYSGRSMCGRSCIGLAVSDSDSAVAGILRYLEAEDEDVREEAQSLLTETMRRDSYGRELVIYWPALTA